MELSYFCVYQKDECIYVVFSDLDVKEVTFTLRCDKESSEKLIGALQKRWRGSPEEMICEGFLKESNHERCFFYSSFLEFCEKNGVEYVITEEMII